MKKKTTIVLAAIIVIALAGGSAYALLAHYKKSPNYATQGNASQKDTTKKNTSIQESKDNSTSNSSSGSSTTSGGSSVAVGTIDTPADDANYPITNEHYRIDKTGDKQFDITLYAIINSPSQHDEYTAQLKQYKQEALSYLNSRYGSTTQFIINWDPPAAKDL